MCVVPPGGKVLAQVISVYTGLCLVHIWVESWVVKFWYEHSVFTLGGVGYKLCILKTS